MRFTIIILLISLIFRSSYAQEENLNFSFSNFPSFFDSYKETLTFKYDVYVKGLKNDPNFKELEKEYEEQLNYTLFDIEDSLFYSDKVIQDYLESLLDEIISNNQPLLNKEDYFILLSRSTAANAYTPGDGTLVINADLIRRLNSEAELAFVIGHEIGHNYFNHVKNNIENYVSFYNSESTQKELKEIKKMDYGKSKKLDEFLKKYSFNKRKHSRIGELACDSFAIELLSNTSFDPHATINALEIFDSVDSKFFNHEIKFENHLSLDSISAKNSTKEAKSVGFSLSSLKKVKLSSSAQAMADSLKTHPECTERILKAQELLKELPIKLKNPINEVFYKALQFQLEFESVESEFYFLRYDFALYKGMQLLEDFPDETYPYLAIAKAFNGICQKQKNHKYGLVVTQPNKFYPEDFNDFVRFLSKQSLESLGKYSYFFLEEHRDKIQNQKEFYPLLETAAKYAGKIEKLKQIELQKENKY